ncbi:MAG TPA: phosphomannomutase/phosphoglucomutase [Pyrinomonadaceae bacterium]|jgi:phosphomannomutase/phosphoglucomutase
MNFGIFREYDIRALASEELTDESVRLVGIAFGTYLREQGKSRIIVGKDNRLTSARITAALIDGVLSTGCSVVNIGETTSPVLCFGISHLGVDGGAMITGSHNPPDFNGIKLQVGELPLYGESLKRLVQIISDESFIQGRGEVSAQNIIPPYLAAVQKRIAFARPLRVVVDCGNGNAGMIAPQLMSGLGCEVIPLYCESDGRFPHHHPDPAVPANLKDLRELVTRTEADLGVAYDGDGNRIGVVDNTGHVLSPDILLGLLAKDLMERQGPARIVCEVKASQGLIEYVERHGGSIVMCRVGYPFVLETMFREGAALAGELTGHICYNEAPFQYGDAIYVSCRVIELLSRTSVSLAQLLSDFPRYFSTPELRIPCADDRKFQVVKEMQHSLGESYETVTIDGLRILFGDRKWALVRASNTEPVLSVRFEAQTARDLEQIQSIVIPRLRSSGLVI